MRRATRNRHCYWRSLFISIHALHEESDQSRGRLVGNRLTISIHALHEESDCPRRYEYCPVSRFQSTLSMRRATDGSRHIIQIRVISIHALHEESDCGDLLPCVTLAEISIHALHEESDRMIRTIRLIPPISIHALHEESDQSSIFPVVRVG